MNVDIHAHIVPEGCAQLSATDGQKYGISFRRDSSGRELVVIDNFVLPHPIGEQLCSLERRLWDMDQAGVEMQALSVLPNYFFYQLEPGVALGLAQTLNNRMAEVVEAHPQRFVGMATVPLQNGDLAARELERSVRELGLRAVEINTNINGRYLDDQGLWPFYDKARELGVPILVHPYYVAGADKLQKYYLINLIGNPLDTSIAIASLIFGGVLERFPGLKLVFSHAGGFIPYIRGRIDRGFQVRPECQGTITRAPSEYMKLLYYDSVAHYGPALAYLVKTLGPGQVVLGSDYPFDMGDLEPLSTVDRLEGLSPAEKQAIAWDNGASILKLV